MITYLIYSTICMGLVLLFYYTILAKEKTFQINRWFLLIGLLFSLTIPFIPIGITSSVLEFGRNTKIRRTIANNIENTKVGNPFPISAHSIETNNDIKPSSTEWIFPLLIGMYLIITILLLIRLILHLCRMKLKLMKKPTTYFKGHRVVLLNEKVTPYTFWKTIFINRDRFKNGKLREEVMNHELIHANQNHTLDIIIVEVLKTVIWFNPILYFYKTAIQVNHEYIADNEVITKGTDITDYQKLLLNMHTVESTHRLSTGFNFKLTKKRFKMMTRKHSTMRSLLKTTLIIPFFIILGVTFGCNPASMEKNDQNNSINIEVISSQNIILNNKVVSSSNFKSAFSDLSINPKKDIAKLKVHENVSSEVILDIQHILREQGILRVNYTTVPNSNNDQSKKTQVVNTDRQSFLNIYINEKGDILINQNNHSLSSVKKSIKDFITGSGRYAGLSKSSKNAVIAIKTNKETPYDIYKHTIEKINEAYAELRNEASMKLFDKPFSSLEEGSEKINKIKNMYPKLISIAQPA